MIKQGSDDEDDSAEETGEIEDMLEVVANQINLSEDLEFLHQQKRIGKYRLKSLLAMGGQGICFLAEDDDLQRPEVMDYQRLLTLLVVAVLALSIHGPFVDGATTPRITVQNQDDDSQVDPLVRNLDSFETSASAGRRQS